MPNRVPWEAHYRVGNETLDQQHKDILAQCNALADHIDTGGAEGDRNFDEAFATLSAMANEHFVAEEALLASHDYPELSDHRCEQEEYAFLSTEIVTTENFDRSELQTFLALWWVGHIAGAVNNYRSWFEQS